MTPYTLLTPQEVRLQTLLKWIALGYGLFSLLLLIRVPAGAADLVFGAPNMAGFGCAAWGLVALIAWFASGDVRRYRLMAYAASGLLFYGTMAALVMSATTTDAPRTLLLLSAIIDGAVGIILFVLLVDTPPSKDFISAWKTQKPRTRTERALAAILGIGAVQAAGISLAVLFVRLDTAPGVVNAVVATYLLPLASVLAHAPMVAFAAVFFAGLAACMTLAAYSLRRYGEFLTLALLGGLMATGGQALAMASGESLPGIPVWAFLVPTALYTVVMWILRLRLNHALIDYLGFFKPVQFWSLAAISDGLIEGGASEQLNPHEIALRVDSHLASFPAPKLALARYAILALDFLLPLIFELRPPLSMTHVPARADFLNRQFKVNLIDGKGVFKLLARLGKPGQDLINIIEGLMRFVMQFAYLGYYGDARVQQAIQYTPFSVRAIEQEIDTTPIRRHPPLETVTPDSLNRRGVDIIDDPDVVIIGSGAGGAILAERLLLHGRRVLLLDKGKYLRSDAMSEDEIEMIGKLYGDNALQVTASMRFSILQGSAVGGTTVANNCISIRTPKDVLDLWNDEHNAGIVPAIYRQAENAVIARLMIRPVDETARTRPAAEIVNPLSRVLGKGIRDVLGADGYTYAAMPTNIDDCLGCGYCNMGCAYGRKLSMADEVLPAAQGSHPGALTIFEQAEAIGLRASGDTIREIMVRIGGRRTITIRNPRTVVIAGGVIASSWLMLRSGIGRGLPIGRRITFNMGSPLHAHFPQPMHAYNGLQMSHYLKTDTQPHAIFETWFNPPVAQALVMPGWLDTHYKNMQAYAHFASMGVLVGTEAQDATRIREARLFPGTPELEYAPTATDVNRLVEALILMGRIFLASGADKVFASTARYHSFTGYREGQTVNRAQAVYENEEDLLKYLRTLVRDDKDLLLNSAHLQGGNPLGTVLDPDFRVRGYRNLYVCDASVFPTSLGVNPQLTVMSLAWYAGERIT